MLICLTVLVYTKTIIHLSVGGWYWIFTSPLRGLGKFLILATSTSVNNCYVLPKQRRGRFVVTVKRARFVFLFLFTVGQVEVICGQQHTCLREAGFLIILIYFLHTSNKNVSKLNYFRKDEKLYFSPEVFPLRMLVSGHCKPRELSWNNENACEVQAEIQNFPISSKVPQCSAWV